ncbi:MAG: hypothetical protein M1825_003578 [Sarcosagium campestre]|nr:MAG: hypothetical protein M1825_003578 [Sarcosagium campestre]
MDGGTDIKGNTPASRELELELEDLPTSSVDSVCRLLFKTYNFYNDRHSRLAVQRFLQVTFTQPENLSIFQAFAKAIEDEAAKPGIAPANAFVLLEWCSVLLPLCVQSEQRWKTVGLGLVLAEARALELCMGSSIRDSVKQSALAVTHRGLRKAFSSRNFSVERVREGVRCLAGKDAAHNVAKNAVLLGVIARVCAPSSTARPALESVKSDYYAFYVREIVGSRSVVPLHLCNGLRGFFEAFSSEADLMADVFPSVEKALLRSPEVVLDGVVNSLLQSISKTVDISKILQSCLLKPLLSNAKSTNARIRNGALSAFEIAAARSRSEQVLQSITTEILTPLSTSKITGAEQRAIFAQMLNSIPPASALARLIPDTLAPVAGKEANEATLNALSVAMTIHMIHGLVSSIGVADAVVSVVVKGLADKRIPVRRIWSFRIGELFWKLGPAKVKRIEAAKFANDILAPLKTSWNEVVANPFAAAQNGLVTAAYVTCAIVPSFFVESDHKDLRQGARSLMVTAQAVSCDPKPSFLLNHRIFVKLTHEDDQIWCIRALGAIVADVTRSEGESIVTDAWAQALIFHIVSATVKPKASREASRLLASAFARHPARIGSIIVAAVWTWTRQILAGDKDSAAASAKTGVQRLFSVIRCISLDPAEVERLGGSIDQSVVQAHLVDMLILCRPHLLPRVEWIECCQRMGIDPGALAQSRSAELLDRIMLTTETLESSRASFEIENASYSAAAELAFVAPDLITPIIIRQFKIDLDPTQLDNIGPTEAAIYRTAEGTAFIDVLATKSSNTAVDKNTKDYETLKWEAEVRAQLASKKGQQKVLSADERSRVEVQLKKEAGIRSSVSAVVLRLRRGIGIIQSLATGPPTRADMWMGPAITGLIEIIVAGAGLVIGDAAAESYLACADQVTQRLGILRRFIGVATLRALKESGAPDGMSAEPLADQATRILYRLRFASEQRPFDAVSLMYILPLLFRVLEHGGIGRTSSEEIDEQVILSLEFLSFHTESFSDELLPRATMLSILLSSMQRYKQHYKLIKDCLSDMCRSISVNISREEIKVLLSGAIVPEVSVRSSVLQAVNAEIDLTDLDFSVEIWLACHDDIEEIVTTAEMIWQENALETDERSAAAIIPFLGSGDKQLRRAAARAIADSTEQNPATFSVILSTLEGEYRQRAKPLVPELDEFGLQKKKTLRDPWEGRSGVALALKELVPIFEPSSLEQALRFLIDDGPLGDRVATVRDEMVDAATTIIAHRGHSKVEELMQTFESTLEAPDRASESFDLVNEAVIILYGALARHLQAGDDRVPKVTRRLLSTLDTPSETVQYAVAECLPPLIRLSVGDTSKYVQLMAEQLLQAKKYASRRGAAYGLAGIIKGRGIAALREYRLMSTLRTAVENKKEVSHRQGALFAYELFSVILGRLFEPYIIQIIPQLLTSFGDTSGDVREACLDASKAAFANLSSFGVKQILPTLLEGLDDQQWRSKKGACELLGAMAYLDPQQLASSLPEIIPPLTDVLNDSHKEVRASANRSLQRFGEVISNPEIKGVVSILLKALSDPTKYTDTALDSLIKVSFIHYLDAPSLALVVRILERGLGDRSGTKRKSAQIIGSLAHLTERKDLLMHLPILVTGLKLGIVDPVPTTRATSSKALGSLIEKLGEDALPDLIPGLMATLKSDTGAGDRLGSAQALSEVLAGLGTARLEETLPTILQNASSTKASVREGFMSLFIFLPVCFGNSFATYLSKIIPPILSGLADEIESIRDTSLRAGRLLVKNFATRAIDLLLPELERGLADDSYRIRLSSVELVGDLLFNLTGLSRNQEDEVEDTAGEAGRSLLEVLGEEKRNKVLSALYICRCDTSGLVRSAAITVWKALVATPRTLRELVPTLTQLLIRRLASSNPEQKVIAGNALGELIRKAGDGVLASLLPTLEEGLQTSTDTDAKQGICIALRELISSASVEAMEEYEKTLIGVVRTALIDTDEDVREAAAEAFDSLQHMFGKKAVDQVLPHLLSLLRNDAEADNALLALLTLLTDNTRSNMVLPNLIPTLLAPPISAFNAKALASLSEVAGPAMNRRLPNILNGLMDGIVACKDDALRSDLDDALDVVLSSIDDHDGLNATMNTMLTLVKHNDHRRRAAANYHLATFFRGTSADFSRYHPDLIRVFLIAFDDRDADVVKAAWTALSELTKRLKNEEKESLAIPTRTLLQGVGFPGTNLPGFALPKGINAVFPIFLQGLVNGTSEQRTVSALGISDIIDRTSPESLKPFVSHITGPLIRVVSERSVEVRVAILSTLNKLLEKIPTLLKPFLPQLQRTFAKSLADSSSDILRNRAAKALGTLITLTPRIDPLIAELVTGSKTADSGVRNAMLKALYEVVSKAGANMSDLSRASIQGLMEADIAEGDDTLEITHARLLGALVKNMPPEMTSSMLRSQVVTTRFSKASALALNSVLVESPSSLMQGTFAEDTVTVICKGIENSSPAISDACVLAAGKYLLAESTNKNFEVTRQIFESLSSTIGPGHPVDTRRLALVVTRTVCRLNNDMVRPHLSILAPPVFASVRDPVIPVKLSAEAAFLALFSVVTSESAVFEKYISTTGGDLPPTTKRSMQDYFRRVALRLGGQARERREAEGGHGGLGLSADERDDEREVWSVGKVDLGEATFEGE